MENRKDWNRTLFKINLGGTIVVLILEIVNSILMEKNGTLTMDLNYNIRYIILPSSINFLALLSNVFVRKMFSNNIRIQNNTSILSLAIICSVIACVHFTFHATLTIWIVPICLSTAFLDYGLYLKTLVVSIIGFLVALIHRYNSILGPDDDVNILPDVMVSFCILSVASFLAKKIIDILKSQNKELEGANEMLLKAKEAAEEEKTRADLANRAKSDFLTNMSHEIRTPINAVVGLNEIIMRETTEDNIKEYSLDIDSAAKSLLNIINDILDLSKIESGKLKIVESAYDVSSTLNDLRNLIIFRAKAKELEFNITVDPDVPSVLYGDDIRIKQIATNLLTNAVKYTAEGSVDFCVGGERHEDIFELVMKVKDTGIGIKEEDLPKLFTAFERLDEKRNKHIEGTGLGLKITASLVNLMDGTLLVESKYGEGSEFTVKIYQKIIDGKGVGNIEERFREHQSAGEYHASFTAKDARILMVDDNKLNRKVFINLLKKMKMTIDEAESGLECLNLITKHKYDIIFLDHMMPNLDGVETLNRMKVLENNLNENTPVIALTANAVVGSREKYINWGFDDYLSKPIETHKLEKMISYYIKDKAQTENNIKEKPAENQTSNKENAPAEVLEVEGKKLIELPEFDWDAGRSILETDELLYDTVLDFYDSIDGEIEAIKEWQDELDDPEILKLYRIRVHALKSTTKMIGALKYSDIAKQAEEYAAEGNAKKAYEMSHMVVEELVKLKKSLSRMFSSNE